MKLLVLAVGVGLLSVPFIFYWMMSTSRRDLEKLQDLLDEMRSILSKARREQITKLQVDMFYDCEDKALEIISRTSPRNDNSFMRDLKDEVDRMSDQMALLSRVGTQRPSIGEEVDRLAALRQAGLISDAEFEAFSERFLVSTGERASHIIKAIDELSEQYKEGVMTKGNYHAALWSLLDKLDRKT